MKDINVILGQRLRKVREEQGYTREQLAELLDLSPRFLADVELGESGLSITSLRTVCARLHVSADFLLGLQDEELSSPKIGAFYQIQALDDRYIDSARRILSALEDCIRTAEAQNKPR